jgi:hypothetical protein
MEATMLGRQERWQEDLFVAAPLRELIPDDHILKRIDRILDLSWLRKEVEACYDTTVGRPGASGGRSGSGAAIDARGTLPRHRA